jgi:thiamine pyrophosphate-dependent acetolactate synthase large subunit-like protein
MCNLRLVRMQNTPVNLMPVSCCFPSGPGSVHLLNGLYDVKADNTHVIAITGTTHPDLMNSSYHQDVNLLQLYSEIGLLWYDTYF